VLKPTKKRLTTKARNATLVFAGLDPAIQETNPTLDPRVKPEGARGKRLWENALSVMNAALIDLDCLSLVKELAAGVPDDPPA
jgi:hypothetical protein